MFPFHTEQAPRNGKEDSLCESDNTHTHTHTHTHSLIFNGNSIILMFLAQAHCFSSSFSLARVIRLRSRANPVRAQTTFLTLVCPVALRKSGGITEHWIHLARKMTNGRARGCPADLFFNLSLWKPCFPLRVSCRPEAWITLPLRYKESKVDVSCFFLSKHSTNSTARQLAKLPL